MKWVGEFEFCDFEELCTYKAEGRIQDKINNYNLKFETEIEIKLLIHSYTYQKSSN